MKQKLMLSLAAMLLLLNYGCKKDLGKIPDKIDKVETRVEVKKYNPYSVENMRKALSNLMMKDVQLLANNKQKFLHGTMAVSNSSDALAINKDLTRNESLAIAKNNIVATHYYIKFMPANKADYDKLRVDSNLFIYPFPLDAAISNYGKSYRDPSLPKGVPTYQYASVPVDYVLPDVPYTKLADLYLPDERKGKLVVIKGAGGSSYSVSGHAIVSQSECDGGEEPPIEARSVAPPEDCESEYGGGGSGGGTTAPPGEWRPSGRITMIDDRHGTIGVANIKVRARRWFTTYTGITDADGYYYVDGTYTRDANYWLDFERYDFVISDDTSQFVYYIDGPKQKGAWNKDLTGYDKFCATIFRAACHYYYGDIQGLHRPPQNSFWAAKLHIRAKEDYSTVTHGGMFPIGWHLGEIITIRGMLASSIEIYSTTIHELTHAAHWDNSNLSLTLSAQSANESWAAGVEWALTDMIYPNYAGVLWSPNIGYRNVVIDLIDDSSQISYFESSSFHNYGFGPSKDQVHGYSLVEIQDALINGVNTWNDWKTNIINNYNNGTEQHVETLFNHWLNY